MQKQTNIALVIASLRGGGAERVMSNLANYWVGLGYEVTLITLANPAEHEAYNIDPAVKRHKIYRPFGSNIFSRLLALCYRLWRLRQFFKKLQPDVVLSFMTTTNLLTIVASMGLKARCIVSERTNPEKYSYGQIHNFLRSFLYPLTDQVVVQTESISQWLLKRTKAKISVIPNSVRDFIDDRVTTRENMVVAVGRLSNEKGFDILIEAFALLKDSYPDWNVQILGEGPDRPALEKLISERNLASRVQLVGRVSEPGYFLNRASIAVQPSRFEGFPNSLLEAMVCGLPCVASYDAGDMLIEHDISGLLIPSGDAKHLALALKRLIESPNLRLALGKNAVKATEQYSHCRVMTLWDKVLFSPGN